jgi:hypothetical protein
MVAIYDAIYVELLVFQKNFRLELVCWLIQPT